MAPGLIPGRGIRVLNAWRSFFGEDGRQRTGGFIATTLHPRMDRVDQNYSLAHFWGLYF